MHSTAHTGEPAAPLPRAPAAAAARCSARARCERRLASLSASAARGCNCRLHTPGVRTRADGRRCDIIHFPQSLRAPWADLRFHSGGLSLSPIHAGRSPLRRTRHTGPDRPDADRLRFGRGSGSRTHCACGGVTLSRSEGDRTSRLRTEGDPRRQNGQRGPIRRSRGTSRLVGRCVSHSLINPLPAPGIASRAPRGRRDRPAAA